MSKPSILSLDRRDFLKAGVSTFSLATDSCMSKDRSTYRIDSRFFADEDYVDDRQARYDLFSGRLPITTSRLTFHESQSQLAPHIRSLADACGQFEFRETWVKQVGMTSTAAGRAVFFSVKNSIRPICQWWLFVIRFNSTCYFPLVIHLKSQFDQDHVGITGWLMARITFRLHNAHNRRSSQHLAPNRLLRFVNRQIVQATKGLPNETG